MFAKTILQFKLLIIYHMKHVTLLLILIIFSSNEDISAQNSDWVWAKSYGGLNNDNCTSLEADNSGNIYMIGILSKPSLTFDTITLNQSGSSSNFIVKFNSFWYCRMGQKTSIQLLCKKQFQPI